MSHTYAPLMLPEVSAGSRLQNVLKARWAEPNFVGHVSNCEFHSSRITHDL